MISVGVVTSSRADYGIIAPVLAAIDRNPDLALHLYATGMHLSPDFGYTVDLIEADGFDVSERLESLLDSDTPEGVGRTIGRGVAAFAGSFSRFPSRRRSTSRRWCRGCGGRGAGHQSLSSFSGGGKGCRKSKASGDGPRSFSAVSRSHASLSSGR